MSALCSKSHKSKPELFRPGEVFTFCRCWPALADTLAEMPGPSASFSRVTLPANALYERP